MGVFLRDEAPRYGNTGHKSAYTKHGIVKALGLVYVAVLYIEYVMSIRNCDEKSGKIITQYADKHTLCLLAELSGSDQYDE